MEQNSQGNMQGAQQADKQWLVSSTDTSTSVQSHVLTMTSSGPLPTTFTTWRSCLTHSRRTQLRARATSQNSILDTALLLPNKGEFLPELRRQHFPYSTHVCCKKELKHIKELEEKAALQSKKISWMCGTHQLQLRQGHCQAEGSPGSRHCQTREVRGEYYWNKNTEGL